MNPPVKRLYTIHYSKQLDAPDLVEALTGTLPV
jgi:hypothetical protein